MRILTWNILHGGGAARLPEVILALVRFRADVVVLTEFRVARGGQVRAVLADQGLIHQLASHEPQGSSRQNGMLIASKTPMEMPGARPGSKTRDPDAGRWLEAHAPELGLHLVGVHVPDDTCRGAKAAFWQRIVRLGKQRREENCIFLGDFNTGRRGQDGEGHLGACGAMIGTMSSLGYADAWRTLNPLGREYSWVSHTGAGRRIDTAFLSAPLSKTLQSAAYSHLERESGLSDHAPLVVELSLTTPHGATLSQNGQRHRGAGLFARAAPG